MRRMAMLMACAAGAAHAAPAMAAAPVKEPPARSEQVCDPPQPIWQPPVRKGGTGRLIYVPGRCRGGPAAPDFLQEMQEAAKRAEAAEKRPDPSVTPEGLAAALDGLFRLAAETPEDIPANERVLAPAAFEGSGFEHCQRLPQGLYCWADFRHDLEAGRAYAKAVAEAVARRQTPLGWRVTDWQTDEIVTRRSEWEAAGTGKPDLVMVSMMEDDLAPRPRVLIEFAVGVKRERESDEAR